MRVLLILCALLAIAVTSLARPKDIDKASEQATTAVPLVTTIKNDSLNTIPASVEKSNDKVANTIASTTPSVTTADSQKDHAKSDITTVKTSDVVTSNPKNDPTTAIEPTEKSTTTIKPTMTTHPYTTTTSSTSTTIGTTTSAVTTAVSPTTVCPPTQERHFDGLSFLGGIILTICLIGVGVFLCKYCQNIHEDKYRTL